MATRLDAPLGTLYVVGTPIGNLEDISLRALRVLREVSLVAAEDTRRTRVLLTRYGITTPLVSYREQNKASATPRVLSRQDQPPVARAAGLPRHPALIGPPDRRPARHDHRPRRCLCLDRQ